MSVGSLQQTTSLPKYYSTLYPTVNPDHWNPTKSPTIRKRPARPPLVAEERSRFLKPELNAGDEAAAGHRVAADEFVAGVHEILG